MSCNKLKAQLIARHNDALRSRIFIPVFGMQEVAGKILMTRGIASLDSEAQLEVCALIRDFADFTPDNDPYGEHDFGSITHRRAGKVVWKIDYYADDTCQWGSENPADTSKSYRVLTIMLASEY